MQSFAPFTPSDVRHRRFCLCVPARWGVLALSLAGATISACHGIAATIRLFSPEVDAWRAWVEVASIVLWGSLVVLYLYGWAGAISQKREWVEWFYELVWWHLWVNAVVGIYLLIMLALPGPKAITARVCTKLALETLQREAQADVTAELVAKVTLTCFSAVRTGLILLDLAWVAALLVELWLCLVIGHYLDELADREAAARFGVDIESPEPPYRFERIGSAGAEQEEEMRMLQGRRVAKVSRAW